MLLTNNLRNNTLNWRPGVCVYVCVHILPAAETEVTYSQKNCHQSAGHTFACGSTVISVYINKELKVNEQLT